MPKTFFEPYVGITQPAILTMVPTADLLRLGKHYYDRSASNLEERQAILIALFSRYKNEIDIYYQIKYIQHGDLDLFTRTLSNRSFILSLNDALRSPFSNTAHKLAIVNAWNGIDANISSEDFETKIKGQIKINNQIQQDIRNIKTHNYTFKYLSAIIGMYVKNGNESKEPEVLRLKALLPLINNTIIKQFKDFLLQKLSHSLENSPLSPSEKLKENNIIISWLNIIFSYLDNNDIEILIQSACKKLINNSYDQLEIFTHLWPNLSDSAKKPFINNLLEKITNNHSNITEALQIACMPNLIKHKSDIDLFSTAILIYLNSENEPLRSAAFFAAIIFSLEIDESTFRDSIERELNRVKNSKNLNNIQNILPKLKKNELDIVAIGVLQQMKEAKFGNWNKSLPNDYADILTNYMINHQISSAFEQELNSISTPNEIQQLKQFMNQWQHIQTTISKRTLLQRDFEETSNKRSRRI